MCLESIQVTHYSFSGHVINIHSYLIRCRLLLLTATAFQHHFPPLNSAHFNIYRLYVWTNMDSGYWEFTTKQFKIQAQHRQQIDHFIVCTTAAATSPSHNICPAFPNLQNWLPDSLLTILLPHYSMAYAKGKITRKLLNDSDSFTQRRNFSLIQFDVYTISCSLRQSDK